MKGHVTVEGFIVGLVDYAHAALSELRFDPVMSQHPADHETSLSLLRV